MYDLLITNGRVIDGAGNPWQWADVATQGERIVAVGTLRGAAAKHVIHADGQFVTPGFVDFHTHSDLQPLADPLYECKTRQGVTLDVIGQDGLGLAPVTQETAAQLRLQLAGWNGDPPNVEWNWRTVTEYLDRFENTTSINVAMLVPHGTLRMLVMGMDNRAPTENELSQMRALVDQCMREGCVGLSTGLTYTPGMYATDDEIVELCKMLRPYGGYYCPHHRNYGKYALQGYSDSIEIARRANVPVNLTHAHFGFPVNKNRAPELLAVFDKARAEGVDVTLDTYPYIAGATYMHAILPSWAHEGGIDATLARLQNPETRARIQHEIQVTGSDSWHAMPVDWHSIQIGGTPNGIDEWAIGMRIDDAAKKIGMSSFDYYCDLLIRTRLGTSQLAFIGNEENVQQILQRPIHLVGSDGIVVGAMPHPRGFGTHARFLAHYVRDLGLLTWEEGIRHMTSAATQRLGFFDRGIVRPGMFADLVVFDPDSIQDTATYEKPRQHPRGIAHVINNGVRVIENAQHTGATPGRALREPFGRKAERVLSA